MFNHCLTVIILFEWIFTPVHLQKITQSKTSISDAGFEFSPFNNQAFLSQFTARSLIACTASCHSSVRCRTFDYNDQTQQCRLFDGDVVVTGSIINSTSLQSRVGSFQISSEQFIDRGQPCSFCQGSKYLVCINATCQCPLLTYFDGSICQNQKLLGSKCNVSNECRTDLNYTCLPRRQCGPLSLQSGNTVAGDATGLSGTASNRLDHPTGIAIDSYGSLYVSELFNHRVMKLQEGSLNGTKVAGTGTSGPTNTQLYEPSGIYVDSLLNIYISDSKNYRIMLWRQNASSGNRVAGNGLVGNTPATLNISNGIVLDSSGNMYICDISNHRVLKWAMNASSGTIVAGTGFAGNSNQQLNQPFGLYLDELNSYLYIADKSNNRVQRYKLGNSINGTTVAGGNGAGPGNHQLNGSVSVYISKKTSALYVADFYNNRIQRWDVGSTSGVTVVGVTGTSGTSANLFNGPYDIKLNANETYLYVSDFMNNRVQRFTLI